MPGPLATSTPFHQEAKIGTDLQELLDYLQPISTQAFRNSDSNHDLVRKSKDLSISTCYEIVFGALCDLIPDSKQAAGLMEILSVFLDISAAEHSEALNHFHLFLPAFSIMLTDPVVGPWVARMLATFYLHQGLIPESAVLQLQTALESIPDSQRIEVLPRAILAALWKLRPIRPDLISTALFAKDCGQFPSHRRDLQEPTVAPVKRFSSLFPDPTYETGHRSMLLAKSKPSPKFLFAPAFVDPKIFIQFWSYIQFPVDPVSVLKEPVMLNALWLCPRPSFPVWQEERRNLHVVDKMFGDTVRDLQNDDAKLGQLVTANASKMFELGAFARNYLHESVPAVATVAYRLVFDSTVSLDLFTQSVENLSFIALAGTGIDTLNIFFDLILNRFDSAPDTLSKIHLMEAVRTSFGHFQADLPRLRELRRVLAEPRRMELALLQFVFEETGEQAAYVDLSATMEAFVDFLDTILWKPLFVECLDRQDSMVMWDVALKIWEMIADINESGSPVVLPHTQLAEAGLQHFHSFIALRVRKFISRSVAAANKAGPMTKRVEIFGRLLKTKPLPALSETPSA